MTKLKRKRDRRAAAVVPTREQQEAAAIRSAQAVTGTSSALVSERLMYQVANGMVWPKITQDQAIIRSVATMAEMGVTTATEAMLAAQMIATHEAALAFLNRAFNENQSVEAVDARVLRATRLMRVFNEQLEAMQRLKGKTGQQRVTVEHVHVYEGGQAIVGQVAGRNSGEGEGGGQ